MKRKLLLITNQSDWSTLDARLAEIKSHLVIDIESKKTELNLLDLTDEEKEDQIDTLEAKQIDLQIDIVHSNYQNLPFAEMTINETGGSGGLGIDPTWYDKNITSQATNYDYVLFQYGKIVSPVLVGAGWCTGKVGNGPVRLQVCCEESNNFYRWNPLTKLDDISANAFVATVLHEIGHAEEILQGIHDVIDPTLWYQTFYVFPTLYDYLPDTLPPTPQVPVQQNSTLQKMIATLTSLVQIYRQAIANQQFLNAVAQVESGGDDKAFNPMDVTGPAYGRFQIHQAYLTDVNNYLKTNYKLSDLLGDRGLSERCFKAYMDIYATPQRLGRAVTEQDKARIHNGGPSGWMNPVTVGYWKKVEAQLLKLRK